MSFNAFDNPKTQFVFGAEWVTGTGISASSKLAPIPVDILSGAVPVIQIIFNSTGATYYKPKQLADNSDNQAAEITGLQGTVSRLQIFNGATFDRVNSLPSNADAQVAAQNGLIGVVSRLQVFNGATFDRVNSLPSNADAQVAAQSGLIGVVSRSQVYNGATFDRAREANVFKTAQASVAGSTAVWAPVAGKKFRLLGFTISLTENATVAVAGVVTVSLLDAAGAIAIAYDVYVPTVALASVGTAFDITVDLGKLGYLSALANNVLNADLSVALTTGNFRINVRGTEE